MNSFYTVSVKEGAPRKSPRIAGDMLEVWRLTSGLGSKLQATQPGLSISVSPTKDLHESHEGLANAHRSGHGGLLREQPQLVA